MYGKNKTKNIKKTIHEFLTSKFELLDKKAINFLPVLLQFLSLTCAIQYILRINTFTKKLDIHKATAQKNTARSEREGKNCHRVGEKKEFKLSSHLDYTN